MKRAILLSSFLMVYIFLGCKKDGAPEIVNQSKKKALFPLFQKIDAAHSNIHFVNNLKADVNTNFNLFNFDYFYNGAGVGVQDLNNDGLPDLFFCGNQSNNKLYLNKGNFVFEDITASSGINSDKNWANGVTFVDVNRDGYHDIYISQGGPHSRNQRENVLLINQGDLTFKNEAAQWGLNDTAISTQSVFFDYDNDGDADCLVMNENEAHGLDPVSFYKMAGSSAETAWFNSSHLYRNDGSQFTDVTQAAGLLDPIFGLGLVVSDINNDNLLDIYMASDYYIPDAMYINNGNGTFDNRIKEWTRQISFYGMGADIADINNDGFEDIFVLDMASADHIRSKTLMASMNEDRFDFLVNTAGFQYQYMYNSLQINKGQHFDNVAQQSGMSNTDWSWAVLMSDFDNDGLRDVFVSNGYRRYALDNDLRMKVHQARKHYGNAVPLELKQQLYDAMPSEKLSNVLYHNQNALSFKNKAVEWGLATPSFSNGAVTADLDRDGDLDLVINNIDAPAFVYRNTAVDQDLGNYLRIKTEGSKESFPKITLFYKGQKQFQQIKRVRGYMSAVEPVAHFGLGNVAVIDSLKIEWPSGKIQKRFEIAANSEITISASPDAFSETGVKKEHKSYFKKYDPKNLGINFNHRENNFNDFEDETLLPYKQSTLGPQMAQGDFNSDGKSDLFIGGAAGQAGKLFTQTIDGYKPFSCPALEADLKHEDMEAVFFDFDNDGDLDLYVVSGGNEYPMNSSYYADRLYINSKTGFIKWQGQVLKNNLYSGKSVAVLDYDNDGFNDLVIGNRLLPGNYPKAAPSLIYKNLKGQNLEAVTHAVAPLWHSFGMVNKVVATDINQDGWTDFLAAAEWEAPGIFLNQQGKFIEISDRSGLDAETGWWYSIGQTDINKDGLPDFLLGNVGLNIKFKVTKDKPLHVFAGDFDANGSHDVVLSKKYHDKNVPVRGRECSSQHMPFIKEKFPTYMEFATASLEDIYGTKLNEAYQREAVNFESVLLINKGDGVFKLYNLPPEAQSFPVLDMAFYDLNNDGIEDAILSGNIYNTEVETPRLDGGGGLVLLAQNQNYQSVSPHKAGLFFDGNIKSLELVKFANKDIMLAGCNDGPLQSALIKTHKKQRLD